MSINLLDISHYQENPTYNQYIDWPKLKADPLNFRGIWIKLSEGELKPTDPGAYSVIDGKRQVNGAKSVNFEAINGYHFYYYHVPLSNGSYYILSPEKQATAFYQAYQAVGLEIRHPMTDCEDPFVGKFLAWYDTYTANKALAFARKLNLHLMLYHEAVSNLFGVKPDIYTGAWWWDKFGSLLLAYAPSETLWWKDYKFILADYVGNLDYPKGITAEQTIAWQRTSSPVPPVQGIPTGRVVPGDALDIDLWMKTEPEFIEWSTGKKPQTELEARITILENKVDMLEVVVARILDELEGG